MAWWCHNEIFCGMENCNRCSDCCCNWCRHRRWNWILIAKSFLHWIIQPQLRSSYTPDKRPHHLNPIAAFFPLICAHPHRTNVFIFSTVFRPFPLPTTQSTQHAFSSRSRSRQTWIFLVIFLKLYYWTARLFMRIFFLFSSRAEESCENFHRQVAREARKKEKISHMKNFHIFTSRALKWSRSRWRRRSFGCFWTMQT